MTSVTKQKPNLSKVLNITILSISAFVFICLVTGKYLLGVVGSAISGFFLGTFGLSVFGVVVTGIVVPSILLSGRKLAVEKKCVIAFGLLYLSIVLLVHCITTDLYIEDGTKYGVYLVNCYDFSTHPSFGGILSGLLVFPIVKTLSWFSYILFAGIMVGMVFYSAISLNKAVVHADNIKEFTPQEEVSAIQVPDKEPQEDKTTIELKRNLDILYGGGTIKEETPPQPQPQPTPQTFTTAPVATFDEKEEERRKAIESVRSVTARPVTYNTDVLDADELARRLREKNNSPDNKPEEAPPQPSTLFVEKPAVIDLKPIRTQEKPKPEPVVKPEIQPSVFVQPQDSFDDDQNTPENDEVEEIIQPVNTANLQDEIEEVFADEEEEEVEQPFVPSVEIVAPPVVQPVAKPEEAVGGKTSQPFTITELPVMTDDGKVGYQGEISFVDTNIHVKPIHIYKKYVAPTIDLLQDAPVNTAIADEDYEENGRKLVKLLNDFRIETEVENITVGPTVTRYEMKLAAGTSVKKVVALSDDISMGLAATSGVRIEAPIPGTPLFGIEVPNRKISIVSLKEVMDSREFYNSKGNLVFALGIDIGGKKIVGDLAEMPHLLISGTTGVGKSVCLNGIITSLMFRYSPEELRFILVDPKNVEFFLYKNAPHLLIKDIISDAEGCVVAMNWLVDEMESRYKMFKAIGVKDIVTYNRMIDRKTRQVMPRIVLIIDELNDLMSIKKAEIELSIKRLAQKARAAGIHLVCATQRPSTDVITGVIKANIPCRIALKTTSAIDSITILAEGGAEKLIGRGDMLYMAPLASGPIRLQGAFIDIGEVERVVEFISRNNEAYYDEDIDKAICGNGNADNNIFADDEDLDPLFQEVLEFICTMEATSISMLQRRFKIGYNRAGKIVEDLTARNFISGFDGSKSRRVIITQEDYDKLFGK